MFERFRKGARPAAPVGAMAGLPATTAIRALEPRFVFDGAAAPAAAQAAAQTADVSHAQAQAEPAHAEPAPADAVGDHHADASAPTEPGDGGTGTASTGQRHEVVVIDRGVPDLQTLLAGIPSSAEVILIDSGRDGVDQLAEALKDRHDIDAIHILSHGTAGDLRLGTAELTADSIQGRYAQDLAVIGKALTASGDLLIYGCDFAAGETGARAAALLARATGADVAASTDATGDAALGGDWTLEAHDGSIETGVIVDRSAQENWHHLLAPAVITVSGAPVVKDGNGNTVSTARTSNGVDYYDVNARVVGSTALWANAGTVGGVAVSLRATVIAVGESDDAVSFATSASGGDATVLVRAQQVDNPATNQAGSVTIRWDLVRADNNSVAIAADIDLQIGDIDGIGGNPNTRESVTPSQIGLASYTLSSTTDLVVDSSNDRLRVSGTQDEQASPPDSVSIVRFNWSNISTWQVTYDLAANNVTGQAAFQHDGDRGLTISNPVTKSIPKVDLDADDSSGATGTAYRTSYTENGAGVPIADTDPLVTNSAATVSSATVTLTNAMAGDRLSVGTLPSGITASQTTGSGTITVTLSGDATPADYQTALRAITYDSTSENPDQTDRLVDTRVVSNGIQGTSSRTTITVTAVDDAPVNHLPSAQSTNEDTVLVFSSGNGNAITVSDVDAGSGSLTTTLNVANGTLLLGSTANVTVSGNGTGSVTVTGSITDLNNALNGLRYRPNADANGADTLTIVTNDNGNTGPGGPQSTTDTLGLTVNPVNDAPVNHLPAAQSTNEDTPLVFSSGNGNAVTVSDVDAGSGNLTTTLSVAHGTLSLGSTAGVTVTGNGTGTVTLTGTVAALNAAMDGTVYQPGQDYNGSDSLSVTTNDNGNTGSGGALGTSGSVGLTIVPVADPPTTAGPSGTQGATEDTAFVFSSANGNALSVADPDGGSLTVTLATTHGTTTLSRTTGLTFTTGDGTADASMTFSGTIADINAALEGLRFLPAADYNGPAQIALSVQDPRRTADNFTNGGFEQPVEPATSYTILDDSQVPGWKTTASDHKIEIWTTGWNGVSAYEGNQFAEINANQVAALYQDFSAAAGSTISLDFAHRGRAGTDTMKVLVTDLGADGVYGTGDDTVLFDKNYADGNTAWGAYHEDLAQTSSGNTLRFEFRSVSAAGGSQSIGNFVDGIRIEQSFVANRTIDLTVAPVADITPDSVATDEDTAVTFNAITGTNGASADSFSDPSRYVSAVTQGANGSVSFQPDGRITYTPNADFNGTDTFTYTVTSGGTTETATETVTVRAVNDAPVNHVPGGQTLTEDTSVVFSAANGNALTVSDVDAGSASLTTTLSAGRGTLTLGSTTGVIVSGDGTGSVTLTGTLSALNAALDGLTYRPGQDVDGADTLTIVTNDNGNTGSGGAKSDTDTVALSITSVNDAPTLDLDGGSAGSGYATSYTENGAGVAIVGSGYALGDVDNANLASLRATIGNGQAGDVLSVAGSLPPGLTATWDAATYTLTLSGNASTAAYRTALGQIRYASTSDDPATVTRSIAVTANDGQLDSNTATASVAVTAVNDAPVNGLPAAQALDEDGSLVFSAANGNAVTIADPDAGSSSLTVTLSVGHGSLTSVARPGVTALGDGTGTVTLTGSLANLNAALDGLTYRPDADYNGADTLGILTNDNGNTGTGGAQSDGDTLALTVRPVNDAPVASLPAAQSLPEDGSLVFSAGNGTALSVADVDAGGAAVTVTLSVQHGSLTLGGSAGLTVSGDGTGALTLTGSLAAVNAALDGTVYRPAADYNGGDTLTLGVNDRGNTGSGGPLSDTKTLALTVTPVNDAPRAGTLSARGSLDGDTVALDLGSAFSDVEGDTLTFSAAGLPPGLAIDPATGRVTGTVAASASLGRPGSTGGDYAVTLTVDDGQGGVTQRSFVWRVIDPAPVARDDGLLVRAGATATGSVLADNGNGPDADPDGDALSVSAVNGAAGSLGQPVAGSAGGRFTVLADGSFRFEAGTDFDDLAPGQTRTTRATYTLSDGEGGTAQANIVVTVAGRDAAPAPLRPQDRAASDGDTVAMPLGSLFPNPNGTAFSYTAAGLPPGLTIDPATGAVTGRIAADASGPQGRQDYAVTLTATAPDGSSVTRTFAWRVANVAPTAADDTATTPEDAAVTIDVLANDADPDGDPLTIVASGDGAPKAGHGQVAVTNGRLAYTPDADFHGTDTITYTVTDGNGGTAQASVTVTVSSVNDAPRAGTLPDLYGRDGAGVSVGLADRFSDPDGDTLAYAATGLPPGLSIDPATGVISGTLPNDASAASRYAVTVTATDPGGASVSRSFTFTVSNAAPLTAPDTAATPQGLPVLVPVAANDGDPDGDAIRLVAEPGAASAGHGSVAVDPVTGLLTYTPEPGFSGRDTVLYTIQDAQGARATGVLTVTVTPENRRPEAPDALAPRNGLDGQSVAFPAGALFSDPDGGALAYAASGLPPGLSIDPATGAVSGRIARDASGPDGRTTYDVTLSATDPGGLAVTRHLAWTVTNVDPHAVDDAATLPEDSAIDIDVTGNDTDADGDPIAVVPGSAVAGHGTVTLNPDGTLRYRPDPDFNGTDRIVYTVSDGNGGYASAAVTVSVSPVNDAPTVDSNDPALAPRSASDAETVSIPVAAAFHDIDAGDRLTFSAAGLPPGLSIDPVTGTISGTIAHDASTRMPGGLYTVTLTATDTGGAAVSAQIAIAVANPDPVAADDDAATPEDTPLVGSVLGNDRDPDGDPLRVDPVPVAGPAHGTLELRPDGSFTYTPDRDFHGTDAFTYALVDSDGGRSTATVRLTVDSVNDAPTASVDPVRTAEDTPVEGRVNAADVDGDPLTFTVEAPPASGALTLRPDGSFTYMPGRDFNGSDGFTVRVSDGQGGSVLLRVPVTVDPVNDAPTASVDPVRTVEDTPVEGRVNAADVDGDPLTFTVEAPPASGALTLRPDGTFTYAPARDFHGSDGFTVRVSDGQGGSVLVRVPVTIESVNDAPVATAEPLVAPSNAPTAGRVVASDVDGDHLSFRIVEPPRNGTVVLGPDGRYLYTSAAFFDGADVFTVAVDDGQGGTALVAVPVTVTPNPRRVPTDSMVPVFFEQQVSTVRPAAPPPLAPIEATGFILPAVTEMGRLGAVSEVVLARGAVVAAVNGIAGLHGTELIPERPAVAQEADRIARLSAERFEAEAGRAATWFSPRPYLGRSIGIPIDLGVDAGAESGARGLIVEAIRRPDMLAISVRNLAPDLHGIADVRLVGLDGGPAPAWIEGDGRGGFWGRPPAGIGLLRLQVEITLEDGSVLRRAVAVDSETGEIRPLAPRAGAERPALPERTAPMLTQQLAALDARGSAEMALIEQALARLG